MSDMMKTTKAPLTARPGLRVADGDVLHREAKKHGSEDAGEHTGGEELADVGLGHDAVDHHDGGRRDQDAERAARGDRAGGEVIGVAELLHRWVSDLGESGGGGDRRAADRAEARTAHD